MWECLPLGGTECSMRIATAAAHDLISYNCMISTCWSHSSRCGASSRVFEPSSRCQVCVGYGTLASVSLASYLVIANSCIPQ